MNMIVDCVFSSVLGIPSKKWPGAVPLHGLSPLQEWKQANRGHSCELPLSSVLALEAATQAKAIELPSLYALEDTSSSYNSANATTKMHALQSSPTLNSIESAPAMLALESSTPLSAIKNGTSPSPYPALSDIPTNDLSHSPTPALMALPDSSHPQRLASRSCCETVESSMNALVPRALPGLALQRTDRPHAVPTCNPDSLYKLALHGSNHTTRPSTNQGAVWRPRPTSAVPFKDMVAYARKAVAPEGLDPDAFDLCTTSGTLENS